MDVALAYNRYKFLGYEFLTWLWFVIEQDQNAIQNNVPDSSALFIGNRIVLENRQNNTLETLTIKGDDAGLEEGLLALKKGALVTEINLCYQTGEQKWSFNIKGESLNISSLKVPDTGHVNMQEELEGAVIERAYLYQKPISLIDNLFKYFIKLRLSNDWTNNTVSSIKKWIHS